MMLLTQPQECASTGELSDSDLSEINELLEDEQPTRENEQTNKPISPSSSGRNKRRLWTPDEDRILRITVKHAMSRMQGRKNRLPWLEISNLVDGRTAKQCRDRWNSIDSSKTRSWTAEEDKKLLDLYAHYTNKWVKIASHFEDRNDNMIKSRFRALQKGGSKVKIEQSKKRSRSESEPSKKSNAIINSNGMKRARSSASTIDFEAIVPVRSLDSERAKSVGPMYNSTGPQYISLFQGHAPAPDMSSSVIHNQPLQQQVPVQASAWTEPQPRAAPEKISADLTSFLMDQIMAHQSGPQLEGDLWL